VRDYPRYGYTILNTPLAVDYGQQVYRLKIDRTCSDTSREGSRHTTLQPNFTIFWRLQTRCRAKTPAKVF